MKTIKVINFKGDAYEGDWNEKVYSSKIEGHPELHRIYINNDSIHITQDEYMRITGTTPEQYDQKKLNKKIMSRRENIENWSLRERADALMYIFSRELAKHDITDVAKEIIAADSIISHYAKQLGLESDKLAEDIIQAISNSFAIMQKETKTKEIIVRGDSSLDSIVKRLKTYSEEPEIYTAKYNDVTLESKGITKGKAYKLVYGMSYAEWKEKNGEKQ